MADPFGVLRRDRSLAGRQTFASLRTQAYRGGGADDGTPCKGSSWQLVCDDAMIATLSGMTRA